MKTEREILSLGPCKVFIFTKKLYEKEQNYKEQKYLNVEERNKLLAGN